MPAPLTGAIVPHAPVLHPALEPAETADAATKIRAAMTSLDVGSVDLVVLLSPHGAMAGAYQALHGTLGTFGVAEIAASGSVDRDATERFTTAARVPVLDEHCDHGVTIPIAVRDWQRPFVAATFPDVLPEAASSLPERKEDADAAAMIDDLARRYASAIRLLTQESAVLVVASANTSCALSPRAPYTHRRDAVDAEERLLDAIRTDLGRAGDAIEAVGRAGMSCARGPLSVLSLLFAGRGADVLAYEAPLGVGYLVAAVR